MIDEGYTKYACDWHRSPALPNALVAELNDWRNRLYDAGLVGYYPGQGVGFGNLSIRVGKKGRFIISGTQTGHIPRLDEAHYSLVTAYDIDGNRVTCEGPVQASSEALTHAGVYALDKGICGIAHVHNLSLWNAWKEKAPTTARDVPYGTPEMAWEFQRLYRETDFAGIGVAVMAGHAGGIVAFGDSIGQAARRILALAVD